MNNKIESKVKTSSIAAAATALLVAALMKQFPVLAPFGEFVEFIVLTAVTGLVTFVVGYLTKHTSRQES